ERAAAAVLAGAEAVRLGPCRPPRQRQQQYGAANAVPNILVEHNRFTSSYVLARAGQLCQSRAALAPTVLLTSGCKSGAARRRVPRGCLCPVRLARGVPRARLPGGRAPPGVRGGGGGRPCPRPPPPPPRLPRGWWGRGRRPAAPAATPRRSRCAAPAPWSRPG